MTSRNDDFDAKVVLDPAQLEPTGQTRARGMVERRAEPDSVLAKGTRDQPPLAREPGRPSTADPAAPRDTEPTTTRIPVVGGRRAPTDPSALYGKERGSSRGLATGTRDFDHERDLVEVLRMWPHSAGARTDQSRGGVGTPPQGLELHGEAGTHLEHTAPRAVAPAASPGRPDDKIALAHLALDLYRELGQLEAAHGARPAQAEACSNQACHARIDVLRGALVEACLLVQRLVLMPAASGSVGEQMRALLDLIDADRQRR